MGHFQLTLYTIQDNTFDIVRTKSLNEGGDLGNLVPALLNGFCLIIILYQKITIQERT